MVSLRRPGQAIIQAIAENTDGGLALEIAAAPEVTRQSGSPASFLPIVSRKTGETTLMALLSKRSKTRSSLRRGASWLAASHERTVWAAALLVVAFVFVFAILMY